MALIHKQQQRQQKRRRKRLAGYIKSRKIKQKIRIKQEIYDELTAVNSKQDASTKLPCRNKFTECKYIETNNILDSRIRTKRRATQPFEYAWEATKHRSASEKKLKKDVNGNPIAHNPDLKINPARKRPRVNYSEELLDDAIMFEQILVDEQSSMKNLLKMEPTEGSSNMTAAKTVETQLRLLAKRKDIIIKQVCASSSASASACASISTLQPNDNNSSDKLPPLFNITSSVSVHIKKPPKSQLVTLPADQTKSFCKYCNKNFVDDKDLAIHQMDHLKITAYKMDGLRVLDPDLRSVRILSCNEFIGRAICIFFKQNFYQSVFFYL